MEKHIITTGKTIDLAVEEALRQLGLTRDDITYQVLQIAKPGFLGFGAQKAKVDVTYEMPDPVPEAPKAALSSASRSRKPVAAPKPEQKPAAPKPEQEAKPEQKPASTAPAPQQPRPERKEVSQKTPKPKEAKTPAEPKTYAPAAPGSVEEKIETFLKGLLEHMGSKAVPHAWQEEAGNYKVDLVGEDLGYLIGRRGDTLDALQHLANYTVNRGAEGHIRISVDAQSYREKREESLSRYARKKAQQVLKNRRRTTLEPMNAYERHVIHAALQDMENITTHSTGTEPNRRVVIEYVR